MGWIGWRGDLGLVEGHRNDLMTAQVADIADLDHQVVAWLVLEVQREVDAIGQFVGAVVDAKGKRLILIGAIDGAIDDCRRVGQVI